jgi:3'-5' exonuclease
VIEFGSQQPATIRSSRNVLVWGTVPELHRFALANDLVGTPNEEIREALGGKFPKHIYHSVVCIGALVAHREPPHWKADAIGAPHFGERTKKALITAFVDRIAELNPLLITFRS